MQFKFQTNEFAISEEGFHYLRNGYNYKTIDYSDILEFRLENGRQVNNWLVLLCIGVGLIGFSIYYTFTLFNYISDDNSTGPIFVEQIIIPIIPLFLGLYSLNLSLKMGASLVIIANNGRTKRFPLAKEKKKGEIDLMIDVINKSPQISSKFHNRL